MASGNQLIFGALRTRNPGAAAAAMHHHVSAARRALLLTYEPGEDGLRAVDAAEPVPREAAS